MAQAFRGSEVLGFDDARLTNSEWKGVITRVVVHVRQNDTADQYLIREELAKSMLASNNSLGGTDLIGYPVKERLRAQG